MNRSDRRAQKKKVYKEMDKNKLVHFISADLTKVFDPVFYTEATKDFRPLFGTYMIQSEEPGKFYVNLEKLTKLKKASLLKLYKHARSCVYYLENQEKVNSHIN